MPTDRSKTSRQQHSGQPGHIPPAQLIHDDLALGPTQAAYPGSFLSRLHRRYLLEKEKARRTLREATQI